MSIKINNLRLSYGNDTPILDKINLNIHEGEFISIIGKSGCGKSSLLKCAAGLIQDYGGEIYCYSDRIHQPHEHVSYLFQNPILLDWRTILENILLPFELRNKVTSNQIHKAKEILNLVGLQGTESKYPYECSGGMRARAALARMLITEPKLLLMDEPFSSLDAITKGQLQKELLHICQSLKTTILFVTHDIQEAVYLSDRVFLLAGKPATIVKEFPITFKKDTDAAVRFNHPFTKAVQDIYESVEQL